MTSADTDETTRLGRLTARPPRRRRRARAAARSAAAVTFGDRRRVGLWILPLFLVTALIGAVLAGGLAALYYAQRVGQLEDATSSARDQVLGYARPGPAGGPGGP